MPMVIVFAENWEGSALQILLLVSSGLHLIRLFLKPFLFTKEPKNENNQFAMSKNRQANQQVTLLSRSEMVNG